MTTRIWIVLTLIGLIAMAGIGTKPRPALSVDLKELFR
jgi:hypothetical protein